MSKGLLFIFLLTPISIFSANYTKVSNQIVIDYAKQVARPNGLFLSARGGAMMCDVERFILDFLSFKKLTVAEARILYVEMMEEFLYRVNQNKKIRPYLHNYPFETKNFELMISFENIQREILGDGFVALVFIGRNNELCFRGYDPEKKAFYSLHREPYDEALKIVQRKKQSIPTLQEKT